MKKLIFSILFSLCLCSGLAAGMKAYADGSWNSPLVYGFDNNTPIKFPTGFKVEFDRKNLYITVKCSEPAMDKMRKTPMQKKRGWPMCDSIEIFIDPPQLKKYVQLAVGVNGMYFDSRMNKKDVKWKYELKFYADHWTVKFIVPFADLGVTAETGDSWRFNLCRNVRLSENFNSTWAHVGSSFQNPANFGTLTFGAPDAAARANEVKMHKALDALEKDLRKKGIYSILKDKVDAARKKCTVQKINAIREEALMVEELKGL